MIVALVRAVRTLVLRLVAVALVVGAVVGAVGGAVFVVGMRTKSPGVQRVVRRVNRAVWNPKAMETAGTPGASVAVVHHVGRRSGTDHETPIVPVRTEDGFAVALPYGTRADWVQNVLEAGRARITHEGATVDVDRPEVVPMQRAEGYFDESDRKVHRAFRVDECLRLRRVAAADERRTAAEPASDRTAH